VLHEQIIVFSKQCEWCRAQWAKRAINQCIRGGLLNDASTSKKKKTDLKWMSRKGKRLNYDDDGDAPALLLLLLLLLLMMMMMMMMMVVMVIVMSRSPEVQDRACYTHVHGIALLAILSSPELSLPLSDPERVRPFCSRCAATSRCSAACCAKPRKIDSRED
jgi:hypothetical protein